MLFLFKEEYSIAKFKKKGVMMQVNANSMMAHSNWMASNSNNVANVNTQSYNATSTTIQSPTESSVQANFSQTNQGTDLSREMTEQIPIQRGFEANAAAIKTQDQMIGSLIDLSV